LEDPGFTSLLIEVQKLDRRIRTWLRQNLGFVIDRQYSLI